MATTSELLSVLDYLSELQIYQTIISGDMAAAIQSQNPYNISVDHMTLYCSPFNDLPSLVMGYLGMVPFKYTIVNDHNSLLAWNADDGICTIDFSTAGSKSTYLTNDPYKGNLVVTDVISTVETLLQYLKRAWSLAHGISLLAPVLVNNTFSGTTLSCGPTRIDPKLLQLIQTTDLYSLYRGHLLSQDHLDIFFKFSEGWVQNGQPSDFNMFNGMWCGPALSWFTVDEYHDYCRNSQ